MVLTDGLISYLKLDESSGNAIDAHNSNDATLVNSPTQNASGKINTAYDFNSGDTEYLSDDNHPIISDSQGSISLWVNFDSLAQRAMIGSGDASSGSTPYVFLSAHTSGYVEFQVYSSSGQAMGIRTKEDTMSTGTWYHIVVTCDGTNTLIYIDGDQQDYDVLGGSDGKWWAAATGGIDTFSYGVLKRSSAVIPFDGTLDEIGIWDRALTSSEVTELYNSGNGLSYDNFVSGTNMQINIGDSWKEVAAAQINIGDSWKDVAAVKINIGDSWKEVF